LRSIVAIAFGKLSYGGAGGLAGAHCADPNSL
jgi:hypothetical protein